MLYKGLESGRFQSPRNEEAVRNISWQELRWLLEGLLIIQLKAVKEIQVDSIL
ncbi:MAG: IS66 family insertion sequence element accessory protein TnpB [Cellulosilyticaceae bacterium]